MRKGTHTRGDIDHQYLVTGLSINPKSSQEQV
jgi:hypothetical protein